ncbi:unnamed protein product [Moneuplotes crassus]|uniref:Uncharacterized protein n=1 Tax=Euplotes crassus TaxID=5936 RepID=A0AAD2D9P3_EUPCR|nr:unnamed protein product [Moneuplotes crassus]
MYGGENSQADFATGEHQRQKPIMSNPSELDWFTFETKIRKVVTDLMEPSIKRSIEEKSLLVEVKKDNTKLEKRIKKLESILFENKKKAVIFKEFFETISHVEAEQKKLELEFTQKFAAVNESIDHSDSKIEDFRMELQKYEKQFAHLREDQSNVREELVSYKDTVVKKINDINENFVQETTKLRLLCSSNAQYSKDNKQDIKEHASKIKELDYLTTEHTHKIYDINDLARNNLNEKLDITKFNTVHDEIEKKIAYNTKCIKDVDNNLKETDNFVEKYLPFKLSNLINDILKPITDEKGPFAGLIPNETQLKSKILFNILNDDGEPTLDKEGKEVKKQNKALVKEPSRADRSPGRGSTSSISKAQSFSYQGSELKLSPKKVEEEISSSESDIIQEDSSYSSQRPESAKKPMAEVNKDTITISDGASIQGKIRTLVEHSTFRAAAFENFQETDEDQRFFSQSEKMLKIKYYIDRRMMAVNENVLDSQLDIVKKKMNEYEETLFNKVNDKIKLMNFDFETSRKETMNYTGDLHNELELEIQRRKKFLEEITMGFREVKESSENSAQEIKSIFHILTGVSDTLVLILENASLGVKINDCREQLRVEMMKNINSDSPEKTSDSRCNRNIAKIGTRMIRTPSTNYRIHSKRLKTKERKIFLDNLTPSNKTKAESAVKGDLDDLSTSMINKTILYKGDKFEIESLCNFRSKIIETLEKTNFPWKSLVKKSIKAIDSFRKKQPKALLQVKEATEIPLGPTEPTRFNPETESGGMVSPGRDNVYEDHHHFTEVEPNRKLSTPLFTKKTPYVQKIRPATGLV